MGDIKGKKHNYPKTRKSPPPGSVGGYLKGVKSDGFNKDGSPDKRFDNPGRPPKVNYAKRRLEDRLRQLKAKKLREMREDF